MMKNERGQRLGYTTGSCSAAAAKAAAVMLFTKEIIPGVSLMTPKGIALYLDVEHIVLKKDTVSCAVKKDSGDDPDVTNGVYVYARLKKTATPGIVLKGGAGIGTVTKKGLWQKIGEDAINKVPREMIRKEVEEQCRIFGYEGGIEIVLSIPGGEELAKKTFNPRLGIKGGLSILGTSGIVEPMSEKALTDTIFLEMQVIKENGQDYCYVVPGNYGSDFLCEELGYDREKAVKCSNYVGETIDGAVRLGMKGLLFIAHIGKFVKVAAGVMNTHSRQADCRMEVLAAHAAMAGADTETVAEIMSCITTTEAVDLLEEKGIKDKVMERIMERIDFQLQNRAGEKVVTAAIVFSAEHGVLGKTRQADDLLRKI